MKLPIVMLSAFAVLTLCLPLAAIGSVPSAQPNPAASQASKQPDTAPTVATPSVPDAPEQSDIQTAEDIQMDLTPTSEAVEVPDSFRILNLSTGKVQKVSRADYVRGAVCSEMPPDFHSEALTAQAVAANTYAVRCHLNQQKNPDPALKGADFSANPDQWEGYVTKQQAKERFGDHFDPYWNKLSKAADLGAQYIMTYQDEPIVAAYHSISTGRTEYAANVWEGDAPYLVPVDSFGDTLAPNYESTVQFSAQEVSNLLKAELPDLTLSEDASTWLRVVSRSESGYVLEVIAGGQTIAGKDIRRMFDLRSSDFDVTSDGQTFTFTVRGYGHGVGLSQYGSDYLARQGSDFREILTHYYTDCTLSQVKS